MPVTKRSEQGSAVVDYVLVLLVLLPMFLGILQLGLVLLVRNTMAAAASEGARYAATSDRGPADGAALTRRQIDEAIAGRFAQDVSVRHTSVGGAPGVEVVVRAIVPALGLGGPGIAVEVRGSAVEEAPS